MSIVIHSLRKRVKQSKKRKKSRFLYFKKNVKKRKNVKVIICIVGINYRPKYHT